MKNINYVISGILAVAVVILFILHFSGKKVTGNTQVREVSKDGSIATLPIAYVDVDTLLMNYNFSKDLNEQILRKQENARANFTQRARQLDTEVKEFQRKLDNGAFLTRERAEQEQQRLVKKQQELQELDRKLSQELGEEQQKINGQLRDTLIEELKKFNADKKYQIILSSTVGGTVLLADKVYDITAEVLEYLNKNYATKIDK
ncbi:OmpH family outer membrane protein [Parabacteroides sp. Marseille-P3160]|uniref:OmpH family outer membrane protein n=1 Tax=Parabacteroides sp. Marseille-P3160 TaxID=1917887 RepID=UPI0009BAE6BC|nr:OmpH family outer membrane protein [Parabacteroides sp. Marseille-P3160]